MVARSRAVLVALGSRGDVQPMGVLASALASRGVEVHVIAMDDFRALVDAPGVNFHPVGLRMDTMEHLARGLRGRLALSSPLAQAHLLRRWVGATAPAFTTAMATVVRAGDLVVSGILTRASCEALGAVRGCRVTTVLYSALPASSSPLSCLNATPAWMPPRIRRSHADTGWRVTESISSVALPAMASLLPTATARPTRCSQIVLAASPTLVPPATDWAANVQQTGYLAQASRPWNPPSLLRDFLADGPAPLFVGFGSAADASPRMARRLREAIHDAARATGTRIITPALPQAGGGQVKSSLVQEVGSVPFDWLFPRMTAVVHHGGAGTTTTALLSGVPSAAVPFVFDQHYHARRLHELGVGPAPAPVTSLTADVLSQLVCDITTGPTAETYRSRAASVAETMRHEDGLGTTVDALLGRPQAG